VTIADEESPSPEIAKKLAQLECIEHDLERLNETEPLPPEFDEILAKRVNFTLKADQQKSFFYVEYTRLLLDFHVQICFQYGIV
jgi:hypothetical protein